MSNFVRRKAVVLHRLTLDMAMDNEPRKKTEQIAESLSGVVWHGGCLFLGSDEGPGLERLRSRESDACGGRKEFPLEALFDLPGESGEEADIESLSVHKDWLWLVTSHALTRPRLRGNVKDFANVRFTPRRYVLGRIPLAADEDGEPTPVRTDGERQAQCVPLSAEGSALTAAMAQDPYLQHSLAIPAKENGLDIEGIAVRKRRIVLGLRGPVLRGRALLLDLDWLENDDKGGFPLKRRDGLLYRKIFVDLDGLGVRDLCRREEDLLILAGPTMPLPAPYRLFEIPGFFEQTDADVIEPDYLCDIPSDEGNPEGLSLYEGDPNVFVVVIDGAQAENKVQARALLICVP